MAFYGANLYVDAIIRPEPYDADLISSVTEEVLHRIEISKVVTCPI
jgi:hypothetical protein